MIRALFFDQDGVIVDTERDGHRVAFNDTFAEFGLPMRWDIDAYHGLLQVGGGKERMLVDLRRRGLLDGMSEAAVADLVQRLHVAKTARFVAMIEQGALPLRPGVLRLMTEAQEAGITLGVCTTSNERSAAAVTRLLPGIRLAFVLAGDVVPRKKPDPDIYHLALARAGVTADEAVVVEDSSIGCRAARAAGCRVLATVNGYTRDEDLSGATLVVSDLGEPGAPAECLVSSAGAAWKGQVDLACLRNHFP